LILFRKAAIIYFKDDKRKKTKNMYYFTVLRNLEKDPLIKKYLTYTEEKTERAAADFLGEAYSRSAQENLSAYIIDKILCDVNAFSVTAAKKQKISEFVERAYIKDLKAVYDLLYGENSSNAAALFAVGAPLPPFYSPWDGEKSIAFLTQFYAERGYGDYINYKAFRFENGELSPIASISGVVLSDLKDYEREKKLISENIESFLAGLPYSDMLLYGERGTGKSSTIHAMLNKYFEKGLRIVELSKENMLSLPSLRGILADVPLKFIIYIDDLSLSGGDERISSLKAALEGSMEGYSSNVMIAATSNRRHIVDEKFSSREDSVHSGDAMQEELSLSDRFGLSVLFTTTTKEQYLSIVRQLAADAGLKIPTGELEALAERWALKKGGRSPRRAKQFIDLAFASQSKNIPMEF